MKVFPLLLCAAAGLAGWRLASAGDEDRQTSQTGQTRLTDSPPALSREESNACTGEPHGSAGLAGLPAQLGSMTYDKALDLAYALPEGPAQAVVMALLEVRRRPPDDPFADPFSDPQKEKEENPLVNLVKRLTAGESVTDHTVHDATLRRWTQSDPAAASAAILKAPPGEARTAAADAFAGALAKLDPAAAMDIVLQAGGEKMGQGAARAWAELTCRTAADVKDGKNAAWFLQQMSGPQQDTMFRALADEVRGGRFSEVREAWGGLGDQLSPLELIAEEVLGAKSRGPGLDAFIEALAAFPETAKSIQSLALTRATLDAGPAYERAVEILAAESIARMDPRVAGSLLLDLVENMSHSEFGPAALEPVGRALPQLLPNLCRSGHVDQAVHLLGRIEDRTTWRESFEAMLPAWMDADPAKARAAFEMAPLTALERERWERHPAFLLNP